MDELIEALQILAKYEKPKYPTGCEHDILYVYVNPELVSDVDKKRLDELGFFISEDIDMQEMFMSFRYGSA